MTASTTSISLPPGIEADYRWRRAFWLNICLGVLVVVFAMASIAFGANVTLNPIEAVAMVLNPDNYDRLAVISANFRIPRALMGILVGAALAVSGAFLQALYRNPLADPGLTGVTGGAIAFVGVARVFGPQFSTTQYLFVTPITALLGALFAAGITWFFASLAGRVQSLSLILIGVLVGGFFLSALTIAFVWAPSFETLQSLLAWFVGSFHTANWTSLAIITGGLALSLPLVLMSIPRANVMQLGDDVAQGLGQSSGMARAIVLLTACLLAGVAVCTVGGIGFVGLMAPHMVRWFVGTDLRRLVPTVALLGGLLVVSLDFVARNFSADILEAFVGLPLNPQALPVGLFLNLVGGVFFLFLLRKLRG